MLQSKKQYIISGILISILLCVIYSNTLESEWHLDDLHNIRDNARIQITSLSYDTLKKAMFSLQDSAALYRPLACLTFALNAYFSGTDVTSYHVVNTLVHIITTMLVIYLMALIFRTPILKHTPDDEKYFVIFLSSLLWTINPIQIQAVTYIVQRMTSMSALFSIAAMIFYVKSRLANEFKTKLIDIFACTAAIILSILSKENGVLTPLLILCIEYIFFRDGNPSFIKNNYFILSCIVFSLIILSAIFLLGFNPASFINYSDRPFSMAQRILTEPRIIFFYISQIFYPLPQRLSVDHEVLISTGLFSPPQTFICIAAILIAIAVAFFSRRLRPLTRFAVLFFFSGHIIESTIIPLELIFEHRNYLPSIFIFMPLSSFVFRLIQKYTLQKKYMKYLLIFFITSVIFLFSMCTYTRNFDWLSEESLWTDTLTKYPSLSRAKHNLGYYFETQGEYQKALDLYSQALVERPYNKGTIPTILTNIGNMHHELGNNQKAYEFWGKAIAECPEFEIPYMAQIDALIKEGKFEIALKNLTKNFVSGPAKRLQKKYRAICYMQTGQAQKAIDLLKEYPENGDNYINIAEAMSLAGYAKRADFYYKLSLSKEDSKSRAYIGMAKNQFINCNHKLAKTYLRYFFSAVGAENISNEIISLSEKHTTPLVYFYKMEKFIEETFNEYKNDIKLNFNER